MKKWYCLIDGKRCGPMTDEAIRSLAREGRLRPNDLVWCDGMADWAAAQNVTGLLSAAAAIHAPGLPTAAPKAAGPARLALILGLCGFIPLIGVPCAVGGLIVGILALAQGTSRKGLAVGGIVAGALTPILQIVLVIVFVLVPGIKRMKGLVDKTACASNLHAVGCAIGDYHRQYGAFPPDLDALVQADIISPHGLKCPSAKSGRRCDYFYLAPLEDIPADFRTIIACDFRDNHGGRGRHVLFADLSVEWMEEDDFQRALRRPRNARFADALDRAERGEQELQSAFEFAAMQPAVGRV